jgi:MFS family permease
VSDAWNPWEPEGSRPPKAPGGERGPDPEPIVRTVRVAFLLGGMLVALMVNAGLNRLTASPPPAARLAGLPFTAVVAALVVAVVLGAAWALRPARLLVVGKRALEHPDPRQRRPRAERARAIGFRGLAMGWASQAVLFGLLPAFAGLVLELLHGWRWELLAFAGASLLAGFVYQLQVTGAVRLAVDDPELRASYGAR